MKVGAEDKKKLAVLGVVGVVALGAGVYLYTQLSEPSPAPVAAPVIASTPAAPVVKSSGSGAAAKNVGTTAAQLDPTLRMGRMLVTEALVYSGGGRNIFSASSVPVEIPKAIAPARPKAALPPPPAMRVPTPNPAPVPAEPPRPVRPPGTIMAPPGI